MKVRSVLTGVAAVLIGLFAITGATAQNTYDRLSIIEEFTSATCPPCVAASEALKEVVKMSNGVVSVRFHMNWPAPNDPWNLDNPTENDARRGVYKVSGIPDGYLNGVRTPVTDAQSMLAAISNDNALKSPIKIDVSTVYTASGGTTTIKIKTNVDLRSHKLYVAVVSRYTYLPNLPQTLANSNGESEFYDAMNKMLPTANGTTLGMDANTEQSFEFTYSRKSTAVWPEGGQYIVAYVQNTTDLNVLNAGTDRKVVYVRPVINGPTWEYIARGGSKTKSFTVTNPLDRALEVEVGVANAASLTQAGWSISASETFVTIPAKGSKDVTFNTTAPSDRANFAPITVDFKPVSSMDTTESTEITYGYLTEDSKVAVFYGSTDGAVGNIIPALETTWGTESVYLPYSSEILTAFPPTDFDAAIFPVGFDGRFNMVAFTPAIQAMQAAGKGVWMHAPVGLAVAYNAQNQQYPGYPETKAWFQGLGIGLQSTATRNDGTYYTAFNVTGVNNDVIGDGWSGRANQPTSAWPFAMASQDLITLSTNTCVSWLYADSKPVNISGVRCEQAGSKVVFSTVGPEHINDATARKTMVQKVLDWLLSTDNTPKPEIALSSSTLNFGNVMVGETKKMTFTITNSGDADLVLNSVELSGADAVDFDITEGYISSGTVTVKPAGTYSVEVSFTPSTVKSTYNGSVTISANAASNPVALRGGGTVSSVETDVVSETGAISMRLSGQNPVADRSMIVLNASEKVTVTMIDATGRTVATLFNGIASGAETLEINAAALVSGAYTVVATNGTERAVMSVMVTK